MNSEMSSPPADKEAVIRLKCPSCSGGLNLRRKHLGISGACVHCKAPITAVESDGTIMLKHSEDVVAAKVEEPTPKPVPDAAPPLPDPRPLKSPEAPAPEPAPPIESSTPSGWGFPQREESLPIAEVEMAAAPAAPVSLDLSAFEMEAAPAEKVAPEAVETPATPAGPPSFGFSDDTFGASGLENSKPVETTATEASATTEPLSAEELFDSGKESAASGLFSNESAVESGWGAKVPSQNHASISPFSTGSAEPEEEPGFAETLFREKAKEDTGQIQPKSPFGNMEDDSAPIPTGALFGASQPAVKKTEPKEEVVLDGDGRPLREMTPEEKEQFAGDLMHFGEYHKRSPWIKRIVRFFVTIAVLGGIGYAAFVFLPEEQIDVAKAKVFNWLEPGSVLMEYIPVDLLPFEVSETEDGEKEIKIKALDGLDNLSTQMDSYLSTAEEQLNSTLPEGAEGYEREEAVDMPEMPKIPKLPFGLGGAEEEAAPAE